MKIIEVIIDWREGEYINHFITSRLIWDQEINVYPYPEKGPFIISFKEVIYEDH